LLAVLAVLGIFGFQVWLKSYLQGAAFRGKLAQQLGEKLHASAEIPELQWHDKSVRIPMLSAKGNPGAVFSEMRIEELNARLEIKLFSPEIPIPVTDITRVRLKLPGIPDRGDFPAAPTPAAAAPRKESGGLTNRKPKLGEIRIQGVDVEYNDGSTVARLSNLPVTLRRGQSDAQWSISSHPADDRAILQTNLGNHVRFIVQDADLRMEPGRIDVAQIAGEIRSQQTAGSKEDVRTLFSANGHLDQNMGDLQLRAKADDIRLEDWIPADWLKKLTGAAVMDATVTGDPSQPSKVLVQGKFRLKRGMLQGLPLLENLAEKTKTVEFTRLELNTGECDFAIQGDRWQLSNIVVESRGLIKLQGTIEGQGRQISGTLEVGAVPGRLRAIDGAEQKVFIREADGYKWASPPMRIRGTLDTVEEDLGDRIKDAWLEQKIDDAVEIATQAPTKAAETGVKAVEGGLKLIEGAPGIIEQGVKIFEGLLPSGR
jgi:hypothetical protein